MKHHCQVAAHCPGNASCCLDSELYRRCVPWDSAASNTTDTAAAAPDLAAVCAAAPADLADLADLPENVLNLLEVAVEPPGLLAPP